MRGTTAVRVPTQRERHERGMRQRRVPAGGPCDGGTGGYCDRGNRNAVQTDVWTACANGSLERIRTAVSALRGPRARPLHYEAIVHFS